MIHCIYIKQDFVIVFADIFLKFHHTQNTYFYINSIVVLFKKGKFCNLFYLDWHKRMFDKNPFLIPPSSATTSLNIEIGRKSMKNYI